MRLFTALLALSSFLDEKPDTFVPSLVGAKMIACGVGGNADGTADAIAVVQYEPKGEWRAVIGRHSLGEGIEDCREWLARIKARVK